MSFEQVKYKLVNNDTGQKLGYDSNGKFVGAEYDPKNWEDSEPTLKRSKTFGMFKTFSKNLEFTKDMAAFLRSAYSFKDIQADVDMEEWRKHPNTEAWYLRDIQKFDFSDWFSNGIIVKLPFKTGGLASKVDAYIKEKFELERLESVNGKVINELTKKDVGLTSRDLLLISKLESADNTSSTFSQTDPGRLPSLNVISQNDEANVFSVFTTDDTFTFSSVYNNPTHFFYSKSDVAKTVTIKIPYNIHIDLAGATSYKFKMFVFRYSFDGANYNFEQLYDLVNPLDEFTETSDYSGEVEVVVDLDLDDCLLYVIEATSNTAGTTSFLQTYHYKNTTNNLNITIVENSQREDSNTKAVLFHDAGDKFLQIITGEQGRYLSDFYGRTELGYSETGEFALTAVALGLWIRQFLDKKIEWSLAAFLKTSHVIHHTGHAFEIINNVETLVHEDMKYFFQEGTVIILGEVSDWEENAAKEFCNATAEFGYKKPSSENPYEEAMGLDEYNTKSGFTLPITRVDTKYSKVSDDRADKYAQELARRKSQLDFPEEDTPYDKDKHLLDLKLGLGNALVERTWEDDFEVVPTGIYSPETATNLRLTPSQIETRHQWFYGNCLLKHQTEKVMYSNTEGNNKLITKKENEPERSEKDNLLISTLMNPIFEPKWHTFKYPVDYFVNEQIYGKTEVNGRMVPNYYFKVRYKLRGKDMLGYLFEVKQKGEGEWKLLKAI